LGIIEQERGVLASADVGVQGVREAVGGCVEQRKDVAECLGIFERHCCALACLGVGAVVSFER